MLSIINRINPLKSHGATIYNIAVNMSTLATKAPLRPSRRERIPPIRGVVHAASITGDELVRNKTAEN